MKVILISPDAKNLIGGIVNWTRYIVRYHQRHGQDVDLRLLSNDDAVGLYGTGSAIKRLIVGARNYLPIYRRFTKMVKEERYDLVHMSSSGSLGLIRDSLIIRAAHKNGLKTVIHLHFGRIPQVLQSSSWEKRLLLFVLNRVDSIIVMDMASYNALKNAGFYNVNYLPNPLSPDVQELIGQLHPTKKDSRKIVFAGHITAAKGVFELVRACKSIHNVKLELLGYVKDQEVLQKLYDIAGDNAESWLSIPGNKSQAEVIESMLECSIFALPSYSEGFPNVVLESMACGCPIIATPVGAIPEMLNINGENPCGICISPKNVKELHDAIVGLLDNQSLANTLGMNACLRVHEKYSMEKIWNELVHIWQTV